MVTTKQLERRVTELENECRHFGRQFELLMIHQENVDNLAMVHEGKICKLCSTIEHRERNQRRKHDAS